MSSPPHALIAGAGIGGLCAALSLSRAGFRVSVFERAEALEEAGAGLQLSPNASAILRRFGALERLLPSSVAPRSITIRRARDGAVISTLPLNDAERRWGAPYLVAHRADLQRALLETIAGDDAISLHTGAEVAGFASGADGVVITIKRGAIRLEATGDCLIGADGLRSLVRQRLAAGREVEARFSGCTAWRALVDSRLVPAEFRREESSVWLGTRTHLVHYPLRGGAVVNVVAIVEEDFQGSGADDFWSSPGDAASLGMRFRRWHKSARDLLGVASDWRKWPLFDSDPLQRWTAGRVALLGDAAHPMLPFLAQGAAQTIEDAAALGEALRRDRGDLEQGFAAYQDARLARASRVQLQSRRQGRIYHLGGPAAVMRDACFRAIGGEKLLARYNWLYGATGGH